jgi:hypothetical protein
MAHRHDMQHDSTHPGEQPADQSPAAQDVATFHGMALFGEKTAYLYHLPMFMSSHDYQAIFEVALSREGIDLLAVYVQDRQENPPGSPERPDPKSKMYAFAPIAEDPFILTDLITPANPHDPQSPPLRSSFKGDIFRGHFEPNHPHEKMGPVILDNVVAHVTNAVLFRKFNPHHPQAALPQLEYFLFGKGQELFLAHVVTKPPDFDQVLGVQVDTHPFTDDELRQGVLVTFPGRENSADRRIQEQEQVTGQVQVPAQRPDGPHSLAVQLKAGTQFYFDTKDLSKMHM